jgi:hypothetical protein
MPDNPIYQFLKQNNLTDKDEATFTKEYADPKKAQQLYSFFKENNLTDKDSTTFYDTYFKDLSAQSARNTALQPQAVQQPATASDAAYEAMFQPPNLQTTVHKDENARLLNTMLQPTQRQASDATHIPQNRTLENDAAIDKFGAGVKEAVTNVAKARLKAKGQQASPQALDREIAATRADVKSGKLAVNRGEDGTVSLGRSAGFWDGVTQNVANSLHNLKYAPALITAHVKGDHQGLADIAEEMAKEKEYISNHPYKSLGNLLSANPSASADLTTKTATAQDEGEKQLSYNTSMGTLGQTVGGAVTNLAPLLIPGAGEAEVGTNTLLQQLAANTPRMIAGGAQSYLNTVPERFLSNYQENKANGLTPKEAASKAAGDAEIQGILPAVAGGAFFSGAIGGGEAAKGFGEALGHTLKNGAKFSGIMGAQAGIDDVVKQLQGYEANYGEDIGEAMKGGFLQTAAMELLPHALSLPKYVKSQLYNFVGKNVDPAAVEAQLKTAPDGEQVAKDLDNFNTVKQAVPPNIEMSDETRAAITGKMVERTKLNKEIDELGTHGEAFAGKIEELKKQVSNIEADINQMSLTNKPFLHETDATTGESLYPVKTFEDLNGKEKDGIVVPKEYGTAEVKESGEGENKTFKPIATIAEKKGGLVIQNKIEAGEETFSDKAKAQQAAEKALAQHYYENGLSDNQKPLKNKE